MLRKFGIYITKSLIILLLATLIFSSVALDISTLAGNIFGDIFDYSSPEAQKEVISKLTSACSGTDGELPSQDAQDAQPDLRRIRGLCRDYNAGKVDDREFFHSVIGSMLPSQMEGPQAGLMQKYNGAVAYLNNNKLLYIAILAALLAILYFLISDAKLFLAALSGISFSIGIFILAPYAAIIVYEKLVGIDTTPILSAVIGGSASLDIKAIISVLLLMVLRTYTSPILILGITLLLIGAAGKVYTLILNRRPKATEAKAAPKEKPKKKH